ncbi:non-reducing end alpha-L-arabinofuranosidase family hydrolase, partial [Phytohabitans houttuyneae]
MKSPPPRTRSRIAAACAAGLTLAGATAVLTANTAQAAAGCRVDYAISSSWPGGFGANVTITNLGDAVNGWRLTWSFGAGQTITQLWNGSVTQSGAQVTVTNAGYNGSIPTNGTAAFGFNGSWNGSNPAPTTFALNGTTCTGSTAPTTGAPPTTTVPTTAPPTTAPPTTAPPTTPPPNNCSLPSSYRWSSSGVLANPRSGWVSLKDFTHAPYNGRQLVYATTHDTGTSWGSMNFGLFTNFS